MRQCFKSIVLILMPCLASFCVYAENETALRRLPTDSGRLGQGLGLFHAAPAQWTIEGASDHEYLALTWAGPADFDGDGRVEWAVGHSQGRRGPGRVWIVSPDIARQTLAIHWSWMPTAGKGYAGETLATADFNGDGFADLAVGGQWIRECGEVNVFLGSRTNLSFEPAWRFAGQLRSQTGASLATADVNGDGFADLVVGAPGWGENASGRLFLFLGSPEGLRHEYAWTIGDRPGERFGLRVALLDVNGDRQPDLVAGAPGPRVSGITNVGHLWLYSGTNGRFAMAPTWQSTGTMANEEAKFSLSSAGDLNGDGFDDLAVGWPGFRQPGSATASGEVRVYYGSSRGLESEPRWRRVGPASGAWFGASVALVGDVNGDGWKDLLVGGYGLPSTPTPVMGGSAHLFLGGPSGLSTNAAWTLRNLATEGNTGKNVSALGDLNDDGLPDFAVGSPTFDSVIGSGIREGRVDIFFGLRRGYAASNSFPADGTNAQPYVQAVHQLQVARHASSRRELAARWTYRLLWAVAGLGAVIPALVVIGRWQRHRATAREALIVSTRERDRLARDLHDGVGSELHGIQRLTELLNTLPEGSAEARQCREHLLGAAQKLGGSMDRLIWSAKPGNDKLENLIHFLSRYAPDLLRPYGVECDLDLPPVIPKVPLPGDTRQNIFLAINEALNNVVKHAKASRVCLRFTWESPWLECMVEDDGSGFESAPTREGGGNGLKNLRARAVSMKGYLTITSRESGGTSLKLRVPLSL